MKYNLRRLNRDIELDQEMMLSAKRSMEQYINEGFNKIEKSSHIGKRRR